jgi:hypothetical protein
MGGDPLTQVIHIAGAGKPFGEVTMDEARGQAVELKALTGWGPTARVGAVAQGWHELADVMKDQGAATVGDLDTDAIALYAQKLWVTGPPGGSLFP